MSESNNRGRGGGGDSEAAIRNRLAQTKHREKRKMAEKENAALRKRVKELEAQILQMRQQNGWNRNMPSVQIPEEYSPTEEFQQFSQSQPAIVHTPHQFHHQNSANFLFPQTRISRSLSVSNSSISSRCSSAFSSASNFEDYSPSNVDDDYVPNCQTLIGDQNGHLSILNEYLDFNKGIPPIQKRAESAGPNQQTMDGNCFYEPMKNLVLTPNSSSNGEQGGCILPSPIEHFDLGEECDLITPMARGFVHQSDFSFDELDLITPRP